MQVLIPSNRVMQSEIHTRSVFGYFAKVLIPSNRVMQSEIWHRKQTNTTGTVLIPSNRVMQSESGVFFVLSGAGCRSASHGSPPKKGLGNFRLPLSKYFLHLNRPTLQEKVSLTDPLFAFRKISRSYRIMANTVTDA